MTSNIYYWITKKFKKIFLLIELAIVILIATTPLNSFAADIDVYAEGFFTDNTLEVNLYADCNTNNLISFGVKLLYQTDELSVTQADKNEAVWYLGNNSIKYPYMDPDTSSEGEVVFIGGKLDTENPYEGVTGSRILLGKAIFERTALPLTTLSLTYGKTGNYKNFVTTNALVLDDIVDGVEFREVTLEKDSDKAKALPGIILLLLSD